MTYAEMQARVLVMINNRPGQTQLIKDTLNERMVSLGLPFRFKKLEISEEVGGSYKLNSYLLVSAFQVVDFVTDRTNGNKLEGGDIEWYDQQRLDMYGDPTHFVHYGSMLYLFPAPRASGTLVVRGRRFPVNMVNATDVCELPVDWHPIVVKLAASEILFILGHDERAMVFKNEALGEISGRQEIRSMERRNRIGQIGIVRGRPRRGRSYDE